VNQNTSSHLGLRRSNLFIPSSFSSLFNFVFSFKNGVTSGGGVGIFGVFSVDGRVRISFISLPVIARRHRITTDSLGDA
jgi:hypothetical protein